MTLKEYLNQILNKEVEVYIYTKNHYLFCNGMPSEVDLLLSNFIKDRHVIAISEGDYIDICLELNID